MTSQQQIADLEHAARIWQRMLPDPREWTVNPEVGEGDPATTRCTCGHPIRVVFSITRQRDGATLLIGSTCIDTVVPGLIRLGADQLAAALAAVKERRAQELRDRAAEAKAAQNDEVFAACEATRVAVWAWAMAQRDVTAGRRDYGRSSRLTVLVQRAAPFGATGTRAGTVRRAVMKLFDLLCSCSFGTAPFSADVARLIRPEAAQAVRRYIERSGLRTVGPVLDLCAVVTAWAEAEVAADLHTLAQMEADDLNRYAVGAAY